MADLTGFLQNLVLDKLVVDHTGLSDRFDFHVTFTPDDSQFNGHPPKLPQATDTTETAPNLFEALQQDLGLNVVSQQVVDVEA
jgi:uncharacterized protein (TIGR03435 family)